MELKTYCTSLLLKFVVHKTNFISLSFVSLFRANCYLFRAKIGTLRGKLRMTNWNGKCTSTILFMRMEALLQHPFDGTRMEFPPIWVKKTCSTTSRLWKFTLCLFLLEKFFWKIVRFYWKLLQFISSNTLLKIRSFIQYAVATHWTKSKRESAYQLIVANVYVYTSILFHFGPLI